jgi:predicted peptidase
MLRLLTAAITATVVSVALHGCASPGATVSDTRSLVGQDGNKGFMYRTLARDFHVRKYGLFIPMNYKPTKKYPVIIFLHGIGESAGLGEGDGKNLEVGLGPSVAIQKDTFPFICIFPQCDGNWNPNSEYAEDVVAALDDVAKHYSVDQDRVTLTGTSIGGYGTYAIGSKYYDRFAAIVPLCSNQEDFNAVTNLTKLPVRAYVSKTGDMFAQDHDRNMVLAIAAAGGNAELIPTPTVGHNCWDWVYSQPELYAWMAQQRRPKGNIASAAIQATPGLPVSRPTPTSIPVVAPARTAAPKTPAQPPRTVVTPVRGEANLIFGGTPY